jgi:hypothetical protein
MYYVDLPKLKDQAQTPEEMRRLIATGQVRPETLICPWGEREWIPCGTIPKLWDSTPEQLKAIVSAVLPKQIQPETRTESIKWTACITEKLLKYMAWLILLCILFPLRAKSWPWAFVCIGTALTCFWMGKVLSYLRQILDKLK